MYKNFNITLDVSKDVKNDDLFINTNDLKTVKLSFTLKQSDQDLDITGATARLAVEKPDKTTVFQDCTITDAENGQCEVILDTQAYMKHGMHKAEVMIYYTSDTVAVTGKFLYIANKGVLSDDTVVSTNEFQSITQAIADTEAILTDLRENGTAVDAEARNDIQTLNGELAETKNIQPILLSDYGVHYSKTASENTSLIKQAISDAELEGRPIICPWVPNNAWIEVNEPLTIKKGGIQITGYGRQSRFRQNVFPNPVFEVLGNDTTVENLHLSCVDFNASGYTNSFRGEPQQSYNSGVWVGADNVTVRDVTGGNLIALVHFASWDVTSDLKRETTLQNCKAENIESTDYVVFTLLVNGANNFVFNNIRGKYKLLNNSPTPPHLLYFTWGNGEVTNLVGSNCLAHDGEYSYAFQFRGVKGAELSQLFAKSCHGLVNFLECDNVKIKGLTGLEDTHSDNLYASIYLQTTNSNIKIEDATLKMIGDGKAVRMDAQTSNSTIENIKVQTNHTTENTTVHVFDVDIQGTDNRVDNITVENVGSFPRYASIGIWAGNRNTISNPKTIGGNNRGVCVRSGNNHAVTNYDLENLKHIDGVGHRPLEIAIPTKLYPFTLNGIGSPNRFLAFDRVDANSGSLFLINNTSSGHPWVSSFGKWKITNSRIYADAVASLAYITLDTPNIHIKAGVKYASREGLAIRAIDKNNLIIGRLNHASNTAQIMSIVNGTVTVLAEQPLTPQIGRHYVIEVKAFGNVVDFFVDGVKMVTATLTTSEQTALGTITNHGLYCNGDVNGLYDNIEWRSME